MCKHCDEGMAIDNENNRKELGIELNGAKGKLMAYGLDKQGWDISISFKIDYCPMCGKKFKEK